MHRRSVLMVVMALFIFARSGFATDRVSVFVSIVPQKYFVMQIGRDLVDVQVMVQPGASPATYEPRPKQMVALVKATVYFAIGVPFENAWLKKIAAANPKMKVVHTDQGIRKIPATGHHPHDDGGHADNDSGLEHSGRDPHIWLSPPLVTIQSRTIKAALQDIDPSHRADYESNYNQFIARIQGLDAQLKTAFSGERGRQFMVFHPSWGYFAHAYGLEQVSIEIEGKNPKPAQLTEMVQLARKKGIDVIFVQPQFSSKSAGLVAGELGGRVVVADPLAEDWLANLQQIAAKFKAGLK